MCTTVNNTAEENTGEINAVIAGLGLIMRAFSPRLLFPFHCWVMRMCTTADTLLRRECQNAQNGQKTLR